MKLFCIIKIYVYAIRLIYKMHVVKSLLSKSKGVTGIGFISLMSCV